MNNLPKLYSIEFLEKMVIEKVNPILHNLDDFLSQNGSSYTIFESFNDNNIEIHKITYKMSINIKKKINILKYRSCFSTVFNIINDDFEKGIILQYKKVSNFHSMNSQEILISDLLNQGKKQIQIIDELMGNFSLEKDKANEKFIEFLDNFQIQRDLFENKKISVQSNPGFVINLHLNKFTKSRDGQELIINIDNINNLFYIRKIMIYINSLIKMTQGLTKDTARINKLCKKKNIESIKQIDELIAKPEEKLKDMKSITGQEITFTQESQGDDLLDMFFDDDEEEEEEDIIEEEVKEEKEDSPQSVKSDQSSESEILKHDPVGTPLKNPNYFFERLYEKEPTLFLKRKQGKYAAYSRACQSNQRRQPVILTDKEKEYIDKHHPGSYRDKNGIDTALKFGTGDKKYWYICPRYWSLAENSSISEEDIVKGKLQDQIMPLDAKVVPKDKHIYEFYWKKGHTTEDGSYKWHTPGFLKVDEKEGEPRCIPCCFGNDWGAPVRKKRREQCNANDPKSYFRRHISETKDNLSDKFKGTSEEREASLKIQSAFRKQIEMKKRKQMMKNIKNEKENYIKGPEHILAGE